MENICYWCMSKKTDIDGICLKCGKKNDSIVPSHHLHPGTELNNKYVVGYALGEGGFGITYIGWDKTLELAVAIKEYYPNGMANRSSSFSPKVNAESSGEDFFTKGKTRFLQEARILAQLAGEPGVVWVRDFFQENNTAYIIMEYLEGENLKAYLKTNGKLSAQSAVDLLMPIMESLVKIHNKGLIHRDISPDNIMLSNGTVKLLDFGAARNVSSDDNKSLSVMLKHGYAPEEQYRSKGIQGPWTDVYALCATLYKCITGVTPDESIQRAYSDEVKSLSAMNIEAPYYVEKAITRGMNVHQNDRYQSVSDLIDALKGKEVPEKVEVKTASLVNNVHDKSSENPTLDNELTEDEPTYIEENDEIEKTERVEENKEEKKFIGKKKIWILSALLLVIVSICLIFLFFGRGTGEDKLVADQNNTLDESIDKKTEIDKNTDSQADDDLATEETNDIDETEELKETGEVDVTSAEEEATVDERTVVQTTENPTTETSITIPTVEITEPVVNKYHAYIGMITSGRSSRKSLNTPEIISLYGTKKPGQFTDVEFAESGVYTVRVKDLQWDNSDFVGINDFLQLYVATDIPKSKKLYFDVLSCKFDGENVLANRGYSCLYKRDEGFWIFYLINQDLSDPSPLGTYNPYVSEIEITFSITLY